MTFGAITVIRPGATATVAAVGPVGRAGQNGAAGAVGPVGPATPAPIVPWQSGHGYLAGPPAAFVSFGGSSYACTFSHTSGTFVNDLANGLWVLVASVGGIGPPGVNGSTWYSGSGAPSSSFGVNGDYYFRTDTDDIYINVSGAWGSPIANVKGANGNTIQNGSGAPPGGLGANGDFYLDTTNNRIYGPKVSGSWPGSYASLNGTSIQSGSGAPSNSLGSNGDLYLDTTNTRLYGPKASGAWPGSYVSLVGPSGPGNGNINGPTASVTSGNFATWGADNQHIFDAGFATGKSVSNPGTATLEVLLAPQSVTGVSHTFSTSDLFLETRRSNGGSAMADAFPAAGSAGLVNGSRMVTNNVDPSAPLTITAGAGTQINNGAAVLVGPGRSVEWIYDAAGGTPTWRSTKNGLSSLIDRNALSEIAGLGMQSAARQNLGAVSRGRTLAIAVAN